MARGTPVRVTRRITPGRRRAGGSGARLTCAVLAATPDEWVGVDLATGALVRSPAHGAGAFAGTQPLEVVELELGEDDSVADPARPEAVHLATTPTPRGVLGGRRARRLLSSLAAPERAGAPLLGTWGPSVAYVDLDGGAPSVLVVALGKRAIALRSDRDNSPQVVLAWGDHPQRMPLRDPRVATAARSASAELGGAALAAVLGFRPGYAVVALGAVERGHVPKAVLSLLPT